MASLEKKCTTLQVDDITKNITKLIDFTNDVENRKCMEKYKKKGHCITYNLIIERAQKNTQSKYMSGGDHNQQNITNISIDGSWNQTSVPIGNALKTFVSTNPNILNHDFQVKNQNGKSNINKTIDLSNISNFEETGSFRGTQLGLNEVVHRPYLCNPLSDEFENNILVVNDKETVVVAPTSDIASNNNGPNRSAVRSLRRRRSSVNRDNYEETNESIDGFSHEESIPKIECELWKSTLEDVVTTALNLPSPITLKAFNYSASAYPGEKIDAINNVKDRFDILETCTILNLSSSGVLEICPEEENSDISIDNINETIPTSISPFINLPNLRELYLDNNELRYISGLNTLKNLIVLDLSFNNLVSLSGIETLTSLEDLTVYHNEITTLSNIVLLENLRIFSVGENKISSLSQILYLRRLTKLEALCLKGNPVAIREKYFQDVLGCIPHIKYLDYTLVLSSEISDIEITDGMMSVASSCTEAMASIATAKQNELIIKETQEQYVFGLKVLVDELFNDEPVLFSSVTLYINAREELLSQLQEQISAVKRQLELLHTSRKSALCIFREKVRILREKSKKVFSELLQLVIYKKQATKDISVNLENNLESSREVEDDILINELETALSIYEINESVINKESNMNNKQNQICDSHEINITLNIDKNVSDIEVEQVEHISNENCDKENIITEYHDEQNVEESLDKHNNIDENMKESIEDNDYNIEKIEDNIPISESNETITNYKPVYRFNSPESLKNSIFEDIPAPIMYKKVQLNDSHMSYSPKALDSIEVIASELQSHIYGQEKTFSSMYKSLENNLTSNYTKAAQEVQDFIRFLEKSVRVFHEKLVDGIKNKTLGINERDDVALKSVSKFLLLQLGNIQRYNELLAGTIDDDRSKVLYTIKENQRSIFHNQMHISSKI